MQKIKPVLTPKQRAIFDFVYSFSAEKGFAPSYQDIAKKFELKSDGSVAQFLDALEEKGYISRGNGSRQILIKMEDRKLIDIPLLGIIPAGGPIEPIETPEPISVPQSMIPSSAMCYALRVRGSSMIDDGIANGDIILIRHQNSANNGDVVVAITEKGATLKRYFVDNDGKVRLEPRNETLETIFPEQCEVRGKFLALIRKEE